MTTDYQVWTIYTRTDGVISKPRRTPELEATGMRLPMKGEIIRVATVNLEVDEVIWNLDLRNVTLSLKELR